MPRIFFDVGANDGNSMIHCAHESTDNIVYAFEPTPRMVQILREKSAGLPNYRIIPKAVADVESSATFYISGQADWGCSSLRNFSDDLDKTWPGRTDFRVTDAIEVPVIRLDNFIREEGIESIEYLHVDAQGADLEVLFGLGDKISIVQAGVIEMPTSHETKLYKDQKYLADDAQKFLVENGFFIEKVQSNDIHNNEVNIYFRRR